MVLWARLLVVLLEAGIALAAQGWAGRCGVENWRFDRLSIGAVAASRLTVFVVVLYLLGFAPQSDVQVYYAEGLAAQVGGTPLVNIDTAYGPGFDYLVAATLWVWRDPRALVMVAIFIEIGAFVLWLRVSRGTFTEVETRRAACAYAANPVAISTVAIAGQNHVWLSLCLALSLFALSRERNALSGLWLGVSIVAVKFLSLVFAPILFLVARRRWAWGVAMVLPPAIGYGAVAALGAQPWRQVEFHAFHSISGNPLFLAGAFGLTLSSPGERLIADALGLVALGALFLAALWRFGEPRGGRAIVMCALVSIFTLLAQKKASPTYLEITMFPLCLAMAAHARPMRAMIVLQVVSALAAMEPTLWYRWLGQADLTGIFNTTSGTGIGRLAGYAFFACDLVLVIGYLVLLVVLWQTTRRLAEHEKAGDLTGRCMDSAFTSGRPAGAGA